MFKSNFLIAMRNLKKQKAYSLINIIGMAVGMACFTLFAFMAGSKLNADKFHKNADRIYSVVQVLQSENKEEEHLAFIPAPLVKALHSEFPEIEDSARVFPAGRMTLKRGDDSFYENNILFVDPSFLSVFTFDMAAGNPETALTEPYSIILSETAAFKYFGDENPIGKVLTLQKTTNLTVTGVMKNIPRTSSIRFEFLVSLESIRTLSNILDDWTTNRTAAFLLLPEGFNQAQFEERLPSFVGKYFEKSPKSPRQIYLFPFLDFRLKSSHITSFVASSNFASVIIIFSIGILLLVVVSINFINLSTVRYMHRTKEIGVRKVLGASSTNVMWKVTKEFIILVIIANVTALALVYYGWHKVLQTGLLFISNVSAGTYIFAVFISLFTAFIAVVSQILKAAYANPADSLRYE